ncbi:hypothetical protein [Deinococcus cellulosilyticus]|uniref:Uncharacterized protein n=1 Tax=Deinococcus cellulosilyticus (strain DSM 18568 / NBRC 106333 / KACC 11606 / 5516J-15) TaxID=1223518 RepID=A0A511N1J2_DEIC1|nr:hypothetical protein [Deinococcus cellulosilyticus]GEM46206.1 hypothetical protein DC3_18410 [Deinococcus cellulosilyticus NBRC 106333 = KACC 11606]
MFDAQQYLAMKAVQEKIQKEVQFQQEEATTQKNLTRLSFPRWFGGTPSPASRRPLRRA